MAIGPAEMMKYGPAGTGAGMKITGAVLQDMVADTDSVYFVYYKDCFGEVQNTFTDYRNDKDCFMIKRYQSLKDLEENNESFAWKNETYMNARCMIPTVRIVNGTLYCRKYNQYNKEYYNVLVKANPITGATIYEKILYDMDKYYDTNPYCCDFRFWLLIDEVGMWVLHTEKGSWNAVLTLYDPHNLNEIYTKKLPWELANAHSSNINYFMVCGKLYYVSQDNIEAWDISNWSNTFKYSADLDAMFTQGGSWLHYNPRLKQFFVGYYDRNVYSFNLTTCYFPSPQSIDLSIIESTFLWAIEPTDLIDNDQFTKLVGDLESYTHERDADVQIYAAKEITTCPADICLKPENSSSLSCRIKVCATNLKTLTDYKHTLAAKRKILQTEFHMQQILEQTVLRTVSLQIAELRHFMEMDFDELTSVVNEFKYDLGHYFNELAKYDQDKAQADVDFIYGRLDDYAEKLDESASNLIPKLDSLFYQACHTVSFEIAGLTRKLATALQQTFRPIPPNAGVIEVMDAIDELAVATVDIVRLEFLKTEIFPLIEAICNDMLTAVYENGVFHEVVLNMIYAAEDKDMTNKDLEAYYTAFLREYNAYNPGITVEMIAEFGAIMDQTIDELCELIYSGTTIETAPGMYTFANKGDCFYTKLDVAAMASSRSNCSWK